MSPEVIGGIATEQYHCAAGYYFTLVLDTLDHLCDGGGVSAQRIV